MKLTKKDIEKLESCNGGYNKKVLSVLGVNWPPVKGWKKRVTGNFISKKEFEFAVSVKNSHLIKAE